MLYRKTTFNCRMTSFNDQHVDVGIDTLGSPFNHPKLRAIKLRAISEEPVSDVQYGSRMRTIAHMSYHLQSRNIPMGSFR